jgi:hypothetical protein
MEFCCDTDCIICYEPINNEKTCVMCIYCDILLHKECENKYRNGNNYTKCPHCLRIGVLGCSRDI